MPRSIDEIKRDIDKVKQEISSRNQYMQGFNQPQTRVGWGSYIVNNDRGLLDAYQAREDTWKKALQQQEFQAAENQARLENAKAIAEASRKAALEDKADEYMLNFNKANSALQFAKDAYNSDKGNAELKRAYEDAKFNYEYWGKKVGINTNEQQVESNDTPSMTNKESIDIVEEILKGDWTNEAREKALGRIKDFPDALKLKYLERIVNKKNTVEEKSAATSSAIDAAISSRNRDKLPSGYAVKSFNNERWVAKKNDKGNWVKVKKWSE